MTASTWGGQGGRYDVLAWDRAGRLMVVLNGVWAPEAKLAYRVLSKRADVGKVKKVKV